MTEDILLECAPDLLAAVREELGSLAVEPVDAMERKNFDGSSSVWIVLATLAVQALPNFVTLIAKHIDRGGVTKIQIGDIIIENPQEKDLELLRELMAKRLST
jgi:hypothetical protein